MIVKSLVKYLKTVKYFVDFKQFITQTEYKSRNAIIFHIKQ